MGHANLFNISDFFLKRLYAKGKLSINECVTALKEAGETLHASEGEYADEYMLAFGLTECINDLVHGFEDGPVIEPADPTEKELKVYKEWKVGKDANWVGEEEEEKLEIMDGLKWKYAKGWRKQYSTIERLTNVTN